MVFLASGVLCAALLVQTSLCAPPLLTLEFLRGGASLDASDVSYAPRVLPVTEYGARGDGVTNDTEAFRQALAKGGDVYIPAGTYLVGPGPLIVRPRTTLHGAGRATVLKACHETETLLTLAEGVRLSDVVVEGSGMKAGGVSDSVVLLGSGADGAAIERVMFWDCDRACILTDHAHELTVRDCVFQNVGVGVHLQFSNRAKILNNTIKNARIHGIQFWGNWKWETKDCADLIITGNYVKDGGGGAIWGAGAVRVVAANNIVDGADDVGIDLEWCDDSSVTGNVVRNCKNAGISLFFACQRVSISGNTVINDHPIEDAGADWWVRSGLWLTPPNRGQYKDDCGHRDITLVGNTVSCAEGQRRTIWIGSESERITVESNTLSGGEARRDDAQSKGKDTSASPVKQ